MDYSKYIDFDLIHRYASGNCADAYRFFGCHLVEPGVYRFAVWAPHATYVCVTGDFCKWSEDALPMQWYDGCWVGFVDSCHEGSIYKYAITDKCGYRFLKSDPFATHCETGPATGSKVWAIEGYPWTDAKYKPVKPADRDKVPMSIYEMHVGSWKRKPEEIYPWYRNVADELAKYCLDMGYTHVELLPVTEYPFEGSWGYQVTGYFAPTSRYGTPQDFMYFVDTLHSKGIGVIMDWVPAHFPKDAHGLAYFDGEAVYERSDSKMAAHPEWGTLIYDYAKGEVQSFLMSSATMFLKEYHIDGLRVDAVTSMLYLSYARNGDFTPNVEGGDIDLGAIALLRRINGLAQKLGKITIAEESSAYPLITAPEKEGGLNFTYKWDMGFMHDTLDYFALDPVFRGGSHQKLTFSMMYAFNERYVLAFSHDECVHGKLSMLNKMQGSFDEKFSNLRALYAYQYGHPGKKLNFMGAELGQFIEWNPKRELDWFLLDYPRHAEMQRFVRELNKFYTSHPAMYERDHGWDGFKWLNVEDKDRSCIAFMRIGKKERIVCAYNFTPMTWELQVALPAKSKLKKLLTSDEYRFGGTGAEIPETVESSDKGFLDMPCSALLTLPPLSGTYYIFEETIDGKLPEKSTGKKKSARSTLRSDSSR